MVSDMAGMKWGVYHVSEGCQYILILIGKPVEKTSFWRPGRRWKDNIRIDLREIGREGVDLSDSGYRTT
jgi:hypothetical protein